MSAVSACWCATAASASPRSTTWRVTQGGGASAVRAPPGDGAPLGRKTEQRGDLDGVDHRRHVLIGRATLIAFSGVEDLWHQAEVAHGVEEDPWHAERPVNG